MSRSFRAEIASLRSVNEYHRLLSLAPLDPMADPAPGQFFMLQVSHGLDPLLKRAFSLFRKTKHGFEILFRVRGKGTKILSELQTGTVVDMIGPLGTGYPVPSVDEAPLIVAGGIGIASVFSLAQRVGQPAHVFYGARCDDDLLFVDEIDFCRELVVCTDDGSAGKRGTVVDALGRFLDKGLAGERRPVIYACGPTPMLAALTRLSVERRIRAYLSLEEHMACGIGACLGCVVKTRDGYKRVCKEGPVFSAAEIIW